MNDNDFGNSLGVAEQAIIGAWYRGDAVEQAQLSIALDIVKQVRGQRRTNDVVVNQVFSGHPDSG